MDHFNHCYTNRANQSCGTVSLRLTDLVLSDVDKGILCGTVSVDPRKAFDPVLLKLVLWLPWKQSRCCFDNCRNNTVLGVDCCECLGTSESRFNAWNLSLHHPRKYYATLPETNCLRNTGNCAESNCTMIATDFTSRYCISRGKSAITSPF